MTTASLVCIHVWDIEPANGPTSQGTCKKCGRTREFSNALHESEAEKAARYRPHLKVDQKVDQGKPVMKPEKEAPVGKHVNIHKRHEELEAQWPSLKKTIEKLGNLNQAAKQCGIAYSTLLSCCARHGFDVSRYRVLVSARKTAERPQPATCAKTQPETPTPRGIQVLIDMLPVDKKFDPPIRRQGWKDAFIAMFDLLYQ
jgi:hypothetical protein